MLWMSIYTRFPALAKTEEVFLGKEREVKWFSDLATV